MLRLLKIISRILKDTFLKLSVNKVNEINNVINKLSQKSKPKLNITIRELSRKQIIIPIDTNNTDRIIVSSNMHVTNINRLLKDIMLEISIDFIWANNKDIIITTNKIAVTSDLNVVEKYIKDLNDVDSSNIISRLHQSKSYLKILDLLYYVEKTSFLITVDIVEKVIQTTYLFNDVVLVSYLHIIKAFFKSDMAIIRINIWDS